MFYSGGSMPKSEQLFEVARRTFDTPEFRGITFIESEAKTIINHVPGNAMPFSWTINPYRGCSHACVYCFARVTHTYMDMNAGSDFETKIVVKINAPDVLRAQLRSRRWHGDHIAMGTATDPYQRAEGRYQLMRGIMRALIDYRNPFSILTKGTLILRDLDLLKEAAEITEVSTAFSIGTLDEDAWRKSEPGTPHPKERMQAVAALNDAGIPCGVLLAPVLPGISDDPAMIRDVVKAAIDAGATHISPILLHLRPTVREEYMGWLQATYPDLVPRYEQMYARSAYGPKQQRNTLGTMVGRLIAQTGGIAPRAHIAARFARAQKHEPLRKKPKQLKLL
jgi:DNA repair photolyase